MAAVREHSPQVVEVVVAALQRDWQLRQQAQVHGPAGDASEARDEAGVAAHELDHADAVAQALRLGLGGDDGRHGVLHGRAEAE